MTCKEKLMLDHPGLTEDEIRRVIVRHCPSCCCEIDRPGYCAGCNELYCTMCWNREIPVTEKKEAVSMIDGHIDTPVPSTQLERLRTLSAEEMARFLQNVADGDLHVDVCDSEFCSEYNEENQPCSGKCIPAIVKFLQKEEKIEKIPTECPYPTQEIPEIKPKQCPCCGGTAYALQSEIWTGDQWVRAGGEFWIECADCGLQTALFPRIEVAKNIWDRRP